MFSHFFSSEPDGAPQNVRGQNRSSTSILVTWDEVPANQQNGIILGYTIIYHSLTENDNGSVQVNGSVRQTELTNLKEFVNYNITMLASTEEGDGPASAPIVVRTDQDSKYYFLSRLLCVCVCVCVCVCFGNSVINRVSYQALLFVVMVIFDPCHFTMESCASLVSTLFVLRFSEPAKGILSHTDAKKILIP